jgi:glyoxylase-like metal-dependent hydrolase (beta-lactamase superfamily II)
VVKSDYQFSDIVRLLPTPGHTIDHYSVQVGGPGANAVIAGDMIHSPLQARYPDLAMRVDYSPQAGETRRKLFGGLCDTSTLFCTGAFPVPILRQDKTLGRGLYVRSRPLALCRQLTGPSPGAAHRRSRRGCCDS